MRAVGQAPTAALEAAKAAPAALAGGAAGAVGWGRRKAGGGAAGDERNTSARQDYAGGAAFGAQEAGDEERGSAEEARAGGAAPGGGAASDVSAASAGVRASGVPAQRHIHHSIIQKLRFQNTPPSHVLLSLRRAAAQPPSAWRRMRCRRAAPPACASWPGPFWRRGSTSPAWCSSSWASCSCSAAASCRRLWRRCARGPPRARCRRS